MQAIRTGTAAGERQQLTVGGEERRDVAVIGQCAQGAQDDDATCAEQGAGEAGWKKMAVSSGGGGDGCGSTRGGHPRGCRAFRAHR